MAPEKASGECYLRTSAARMAALMAARTVAIVGASTDPGKITGRPLAYMLSRGFQGELFPVNPNADSVQGIKSYPSLSALPVTVDLAIIGMPAYAVEAVVKEGIEAGVKAFVIFSSGFAEASPEGDRMQKRLAALAQEHEVSILGPNCLGVANSRTGLIASFTTALEETPLQHGGFALVSQSGALGAYWMDICLRAGIGFSKWITTGNECDLDAAAAIAYLADDPDTRVIGLYIEDIHNTATFRLALQHAARMGKPVLAIKAGRSEVGAIAAASHTGALAGDDALYAACLEQHGALRVNSLSEMIDIARIFLFHAVPAGPRLAVLSVSGGAGVMIADEAHDASLQLPSFNADTISALSEALPSFVTAANPLDLTGNVVQNTASVSATLNAVASDAGNDVIILFVGLMHSIAHAFTDAIAQVRSHLKRPVIVIWIGAKESSVTILEQAGIPVFLDIPPALRALGSAVRLMELQRRALTVEIPAAIPVTRHPSKSNHQALAEWQGKKLLREAGISGVPDGFLIPAHQSGDPLPTDRLHYPAVAKLQANNLLHKSDIGGVVLNLSNEQEVRDAIQELKHIAQINRLDIDGILIEPMLEFDHEFLVGFRRDDRFGPALTLGRGGIEVELDADVITRLLPLDAGQIAQMIQSLRCAKLFQGFRGQPAIDIEQVAEQIATMSQAFIQDPRLLEIEINPLAIKGTRAWVLDAIVTRAIP